MALFGKPDPAREELDFLVAEYRALELTHGERVERMVTYRDEQMRVRDPNMEFDRADLSDYGRKPRHDAQQHRHRITLPLGKAITVKHAYRIAGRLPDIVVDQRDETAQENYRSDAMEKIAWAIMRASQGETTLASGSWNASEVGSACFDIYMDHKRNIPIFRSVDPIGIYEVPGVDDPHDFQRLYRVWDSPVASVQNEYRGQSFRGKEIDVSKITAFYNQGGVDMARIVQLCDTKRKVRFAVSADSAVGLFEYEHDHGFVPYAIIPNLGPYDTIWGFADYEFVRALTEYIPLLLSREADVIKAVSGGSYQEIATGVNSETLAKIIRDGGVASVKRDSEIKPIEPPRMPEFLEAHGDRAFQLMKMLGFAPDAAWGMPGSGSGTDRGLQLQPLMEYTAMKQLNWQNGLGKLFGMAYQIIEQKMIGTSTYRGTRVSGPTARRTPVSFTFGPKADPEVRAVESADPTALPEQVELPRTPKELFDGDYEVRFVWRNMVDPDDPAYVLSELNKFQTGIQSLETTLENLGVQAPEDEMKRIEAEAERFPWVRDGVVKLIQLQLAQAQGVGGGAPADQAGNLGGALESLTGPAAGGASGALNADAGAAALGPSGIGQLYGGA